MVNPAGAWCDGNIVHDWFRAIDGDLDAKICRGFEIWRWGGREFEHGMVGDDEESVDAMRLSERIGVDWMRERAHGGKS